MLNNMHILHQFLFHYLFVMLLLLRIIITMRIGSYFFIWLVIEATVFFTVPLIILDRSRPNFNTESVIVYFIYQAVARILILCGVIQWIRDTPSLLLVLGIIVKLGVVPFHVWVLPVLKGCGFLIFFLLLVPIKFPVYILSRFWVEDFLPLLLIRIMVGVFLAMNQRSLLRLIGASRISSTGVLLLCLKIELFDWYFVSYAASVGCVLYGLFGSEGLITSFGILSLLGLPFLPMFFPKLSLLIFSINRIPFTAFFVLTRFILSALYYVKFLPSGLIKVSSQRLRLLGSLVLISVAPIL